jgi:ribosomal protein S18 acetylase RimI-like enzyme
LEDDVSGVMGLMDLFSEKNSKEELKHVLTAEPAGPYGIWLAKNELQTDVGFSIWYHFQELEAYLWLVAVKSGYRQGKVGINLIDLAIKDASELKYKKMSLETFESCKGMVKLCTRRNFHEIERVPCIWNNKEDKKIKYSWDLF